MSTQITKIKNFIRNFDKAKLFLAVVGLNLLASVVYLMITRGEVLDKYVVLLGKDRYMDFFNHIRYVEDPKNTYYVIKDACFPPFAYIFYWILNRILPSSQAIGTTWEVIQPYALLLYVLYISVLAVLLYYTLLKICKKVSPGNLLLITCSILLSHIFVFGVIERGNSAYIVAILLLGFYLMRDSESKVKRELAMILLAMAAGFKVYPAIFGILYIAEKRYKEAIRLVIYGVVIFFVPFAFFGGFDAIIQFVKNQAAVHYNITGSMQSIYAICRMYIKNVSVADGLSTVLRVLYFVLALVIGGWSRIDSYKRYWLLVNIMIILPSWSGGYTRAYLILPLIMLLECDKNGSFEKLYVILCGIVFSLMTYNADIFGTVIGEYFVYLAMHILTLIFLAQGVADIGKITIEKIKRNKMEVVNE